MGAGSEQVRVALFVGATSLLCAAVCLLWPLLRAALAGPPTWETLLPQHENDDYPTTRPRHRYSHGLTVVGSEIILSQGYFYNHKRYDPTLCKDVWAFTPVADAGKPGWRLVNDGNSGNAPQARMSHVAVSASGSDASSPPTLLIFGGDIGVSSSQEGDTKLNDLWSLDVRSGAWTELTPESNSWPGTRASFTGVELGGGMVIYGGRGHKGALYGDLWRFDFKSKTWKLLIGAHGSNEGSEEHPGARASHEAVVGPGGSDMYVYGGFRMGSGFNGRLEDMWIFKSSDVKWQKVQQANSDGGRANFQMALYPVRLEGEDSAEPGLVTFAGSQCTPKCLLTGSLSFFSFRTKTWYQVPVTKEPYTRYHHGMVACNGSLVHFGGESYEPYMYHNSVNRIVLSQSIPNIPRPPFDATVQEL